MTFTPDGPARRGRLRARRRHARARKNCARHGGGAASEVELRVVGAPGWGNVEPPANVRWLGQRRRRGSPPLPRRACVVYPSLYEGFGIPVARGDGLRRARRDERAAVRRRRSRAARRARRPARRRRDRRRDRGASARREELAPPASNARAAFTLGRDARATREVYEAAARDVPSSSSTPTSSAAGAPATRRTSRTCCARSGCRGRLRFAAITRRPDLVPAGRRADRAAGALAGAAHGLVVPAPAPPPAAGARAFLHALPLALPCPAVLTVQDLSFERDRSLMGARATAIFRLVVPRSARRARRVLAVSQRTKGDLVELYGFRPKKIVVTPHAVDP